MRQPLVNTGRREGCRLAVRAAESVFSACSVVHPCATSWPSSPGGKHVTGFSGRFTPLQIQFLCHLKGTQDVTGLAFVSPVVHVGEPKPSSSGRRCRRRRRMIADFRRKSEAPQGPILKKSSLPNIRTYPQGSAQLLPEEGALRYGIGFCITTAACRRARAPFHRKGVAPSGDGG